MNQTTLEEEHLSFTEDFKRRIRRTRTTRWIRFAVVSLLFCGSSNQRLVDVRHWLVTGEIMEWESDF